MAVLNTKPPFVDIPKTLLTKEEVILDNPVILVNFKEVLNKRYSLVYCSDNNLFYLEQRGYYSQSFPSRKQVKTFLRKHRNFIDHYEDEEINLLGLNPFNNATKFLTWSEDLTYTEQDFLSTILAISFIAGIATSIFTLLPYPLTTLLIWVLILTFLFW
jgi:predicted MPP superfamily phosphohydrolase